MSASCTEVAYIANTTALGGAERYLLTLINGMGGTRCRVFMPESPAAVEFVARSGHGVQMDVLRTCGYSLNPREFLRSAQFYRKLESHIIHFNLGNPCASTVDIVAARGTTRARIVATTHLPTIAETRRERLAAWAALRCAHVVVAVCESARRYLIESGVPGSRVTVIYNGVEDWETDPTKLAELRSDLGLCNSGLVIGTIARLETQKGLGHLIRAFKTMLSRVPDALLCVIGEGTERSSLELLARELGVSDRVRLCGWRDDARDVLRLFDVFALPSLFESFPFVIPEAMLAAKPVVASDVGGVGEAVADGVTGILVKPGDVDSLSKAIAQLAISREARIEMGLRARAVALDRFSAEAMVSRTRRLYQELLTGSTGS